MSATDARRSRRTRALAVALMPVVIALGLGSRAALTGVAAKLAGDALYTTLLYLLVLAIRPRWPPWRLAALAGAASVVVELAQLTPYPARLAARHVLWRLMLGTTFGLIDLVGYALGGALAVLVHRAVMTIADGRGGRRRGRGA